MKNIIEDKSYIPGAGAFEIAAFTYLMEFAEKVEGKEKIGV